MFLIHVASIFILAGASFYAGARYGSRGLAAVKAEIAVIENEIAKYGLNPLLNARDNVKNILGRLKSKV